MSDLISRQAAIDAADRSDYTGLAVEDVKKVTDEVVKELKQLLSADAVERKRGRWIHGRELGRERIGDCITAIFYEDWKCSACGCTVEEERQPLWNFCPSCGAEMRGENNG